MEKVDVLAENLAGIMDLIPDFLQKGRAVNTCCKYENGFMRWKRWALDNGLFCLLWLSISLYMCVF